MIEHVARAMARDRNRLETFKHLSELYGLDARLAVFRLFRRFWDDDEASRPMLALLCACARDPLLRASASVVLDLKVGALATPAMLAASAGRTFSPKTRSALGRNLASSWTQSGHLVGKVRKTRARATAPSASRRRSHRSSRSGSRRRMVTSPISSASSASAADRG
jgi:hypothetical protein